MDLLTLVASLSLNARNFIDGLNSSEREAKTFGQRIGGALGTAAKIGAGALAAATGAAVKFGSDSVKTGMEFDTSMSQVAATMGFTVDQLNATQDQISQMSGAEKDAAIKAQEEFSQLRNFAREMGSSTAFSAGEAADALNYMALAGYDAKLSMEMLPGVLNLAQAGSIGLAEASDTITDVQSALGLSTEEVIKLEDQMAKASSRSNTSIGQLGQAMLTVGGTAKDLKGGTQEVTTALGILANNGIKGAEGGTALRNIMQQLAPKSEDAGKAMEALGFNAYDANGNLKPLNETFKELSDSLSGKTMQQSQALLKNMFNVYDLKSVRALMAGSITDVKAVSEELLNSGVSWEKYEGKAWAANGVVEGVVDEIIYNLETLGTSHDELQQYLQFEYDIDAEDALKMIETAQTAIKEHGPTWDALSEEIANCDGALEDMAKTMNDNLAGDLKNFNSALDDARIELSDQLTPSLREFVQMGTEGIRSITKGFKEDGLTGAMDALGNVISNALDYMLQKLPQVIEAGAALLAALASGIINSLPTLLDAAVQTIQMLAGYIKEGAPEMIPAAIEAIMSFNSGIIDSLPEILEAALSIIEGLANGILEGIPILIEKLPELITSLVDFLVSAIPTITETGVKLLVAIIENLPEIISGIISAIPQIITALVGGILQAIPEIAAAGIELFVALVTSIPAILAGIAQGLMLVLEGIFQWFADNGPGKMIETGANLLGKLGEGIFNAIALLSETVTSVLGGFVQFIMEHFPEILEAGGKILLALGEGIIGAIFGLGAIAIEIVAGLIGFLAENYEEILKAGGDIINWIIDGIKNVLSDLWNVIVEIGTAIVNKLGEFINGVLDVGKKIGGAIGDGINTAKETIGGIVNAIGTAIHDGFDTAAKFAGDVWQGTQTAIDTAWDGINTTIGETIDSVSKGINEKLSGAAKTAGDMWDGAKKTVDDVWGGITKTVGGAIDNIVQDISGKLNDSAKNAGESYTILSDTIGNAAESMWNVASGLFESATDALSDIWEGLGKTVTDIMGSIPKNVSDSLGGVIKLFKDVWEGVVKTTNEVFGGIGTSVSDAIGSLGEVIGKVFDQVTENVKKLIDAALTWGGHLITNFVNGIFGKVKEVGDAIKNVGNVIKQNLGFSEPEEGPLSNFHTFAPDMIDLFIEGINENAHRIGEAFNSSLGFDMSFPNVNSANVASVTSGSVYSGNYVGGEVFASAIVDALKGVTLEVNIGNERIEGVVAKAIDRRNYRSGGR